MSSSVGRIALGLVGAVIGAPFGMSAIGFSIGSSIGGAVFAETTSSSGEGPRLGDTNVTVSSLGKVIAEHWGVTRTSGNVIWSSGLKEVKTEETTTSGGKGGGGGHSQTTTTYTYFASFALSLGRGPATSIRKIWADGKLIYDGTGGSGTDNSKFRWRLLKGTATSSVDPMLAESGNRRLAGLPDVGEGNQPESTYTTMVDIIATAASGTDGRSELYASLLADIKAEAESGFGIPDYGFTPAYRNLAVLVFEELPLFDFGNRIPVLTAEVVWGAASDSLGQDTDTIVVPTSTDVSEIASRAVPDGLMAGDLVNHRVYANSGGYLRRFSAETVAEDRQKTIDPEAFFTIDEVAGPVYKLDGFVIDKLYATGTSGNVAATGTMVKTHIFDQQSSTQPVHFIISGSGMEVIGWTQEIDTNFDFGTAVYMRGAYHRFLLTSTDFGQQQTDGETGDHFASISGNTITFSRFNGGSLTSSVTTGTNAGASTPVAGPMAHGSVDEDGVAFFHATKHGPTALWVGKYKAENNAILSGDVRQGVLKVKGVDNVSINNPFSANISYIAAAIFSKGTEEIFMVVALANGATGVVQLDESLRVGFTVEIANLTPPTATSGLTRSDVSNNTLAFAGGRDILEMSLVDGTYVVHTDVLATAASPNAQSYYATVGGLLLWEDGIPRLFYAGDVGGPSRDHGIAVSLPSVVADICRRGGMLPHEFDVSGVSDLPVHGYTIARAVTGRKGLETLMQAYAIDGVETDWALKFSDRDSSSLRTINEDDLGEIDSPTGKINWRETRQPEYDLPSEININYSDPLRDYQSGTVHKRRISNPVPSMYSNSIVNIELALVMKEGEAEQVAERLLYLSWMSRDTSAAALNWTHADLDPGDVVSVQFNDGRLITDRVEKVTLGANFEIELETTRAGDPVYTASPQTLIPTGSIPTVNSPVVVPSEMFAFDIPLLFDYHATNRTALRYYTAVGAESGNWAGATIFKSFDGTSYSAANAATFDVSWGDVMGTLGAPRALWTTDRDNVLRIALAKDRGDIVSVTREELLNGANRALVLNRQTGVGEIIQFQTATVVDNGATVVLSNLTRGGRGTEYAVDQHTTGEVFILLNEAAIQVEVSDLATRGTTAYFKAVSSGQIINAVAPRQRRIEGRSLMPYAPSRLRRTTNGANLAFTWSRRTRVGGGWDMSTPLETVPLSEDFEQYEVYLLPSGDAALSAFNPADAGSYLAKVVTSEPNHNFTATALTGFGINITDRVNIAVYQVSAQVGRGFPALGSLAP
jgi:hypothetical protein